MKYLKKYNENINFDEFDYEEEELVLINKELFFKFLEKYDIEKEFINQFNNKKYKDINDYLENTHPKYYIVDAFDWKNTVEEEDFWDIVNDFWRKYYKKNIINENINFDEFDYEEEEPNKNVELFFKFLEEKGIRDQFINCFNKSSWKEYNPQTKQSYKNIVEYLDKITPYRYISSAFNWLHYDYLYWDDIHSKWIEYYENYIKHKTNENINWEFDYEEEKPVLTNKELFFKFLKEHDIKNEFINCFNNSEWRNKNPHTHKKYKNLDDYLNNTKPENYILHAFNWGCIQWELLDKKWVKYYRKHKTNENINFDEFDYEEEEPNYNKELFLKFLEENNVKKEFIDCFNKSNWKKKYNCENVDEFLNKTKPDNYLSNAFSWTWDNLYQNISWDNLQLKWEEYYNLLEM